MLVRILHFQILKCILIFTFFSALPPMGMLVERAEVISFSQPVDSGVSVLFVKNPKDAVNYTAYTESLHSVTWIFIAIFGFLAPLFLYVTNK